MAKRYPPEFKQRALRLFAEHEDDYPSEWQALTHVASKLGVNAETLRSWRRQQQVNDGQRAGVTTDAAAEIKQLKRKVAELERANEILKSASVFFAKELDRPTPR